MNLAGRVAVVAQHHRRVVCEMPSVLTGGPSSSSFGENVPAATGEWTQFGGHLTLHVVVVRDSVPKSYLNESNPEGKRWSISSQSSPNESRWL